VADKVVRVVLQADVASYQANLSRAAASTRDLGGQAAAASAVADRSFMGIAQRAGQLGTSMVNVGKQMTLGITAPLLALGAVAIKAASDMEETQARVGTAFGESGDQIRAWAQNAATSMGLSREEAMSAASDFGLLFSSMGVTQEAAAGMSMEMVQLAVDMASLHNVPLPQALEAIRSGLVGESEPLRAFGILLSEAAIQEEGLRLGLIQTGQVMSEQEKVTARLSLITQQGAIANGDFARTAEGVANSQKIAQATFKDAAAELGEHLLPMYGSAVNVVSDLVSSFAELPDGAQKAILGFGGIAAAAGPALVGTGAVLRSIQSITEASPRVGAALSATSSFLMGPWGIALGVATVALGAFVVRSAEAAGKVRDYTAAIEADEGALTRNTASQIANTLEREGALQIARELGIAEGDLTAALLGDEEALRRVNQAIADNTLVAYDQLTGMEIRAGKGQELAEIIHGEGTALDAATEAAKRKTEEEAAGLETTQEVTSAAQGHTVAVQELTEAQKALNETIGGFTDPLTAYQDALTQKEERERITWEKTHEGTESGKASWESFREGIKLTTEEFIAQLQSQVDAQTKWAENMIILSTRVSADTLAIMQGWGPEMAGAVELMVNASDEELRKMEDLFRRDTEASTNAVRDTIERARPVLAHVAGVAGRETADALARELAAGRTTVEAIMRDYNIIVGDHVNTILGALGRAPMIDWTPEQRAGFHAEGAVVDFYARGGTRESHVAQVAPAGSMRVWAEPETGGEAYIPLAASKRERSSSIWRQVGRRLGIDFAEMADGGVLPGPPGFEPLRWFADPGRAGTQRIYDEAAAWIKANQVVAGPSGPVGPIAQMVEAMNAARGWAAHWGALYQLVQHESGFNPNAQNPTSTAYGLFQFLDSTWASVGIGKTSDPRMQTEAGLRYIAQRYGTPSGAWAFWTRNHWYDQGGYLPPGISIAHNTTGVPERVLPPGATRGGDGSAAIGQLRQEIRALRELIAQRGTGASFTVNDCSGDPVALTQQVKMRLRAQGLGGL
jgi:hypothetical protein